MVLKTRYNLIKAAAVLLSLALSFSLSAQDAQPAQKGGTGAAPANAPKAETSPAKSSADTVGVGLKQVTDELRSCQTRAMVNRRKERHDQEGATTKSKSGILGGAALLDAPEDEEYVKEMERLLQLELGNVKKTIEEVMEKHKKYVLLFPEEKRYQEITLEDVQQTFKDGEFVGIKKVLAINYDANGSIDCVVLDSYTRNLDNSNLWTRKILRLFYPDVQFMELETHRFNYKLTTFLERTSPWVQLKAIRAAFRELRTTLYTMDRYMADRQERQKKIIGWQIDF